MSSINQIPGQAPGTGPVPVDQNGSNTVGGPKVRGSTKDAPETDVESDKSLKKLAEQSAAQDITASQAARLATITGASSTFHSTLPDLPKPPASSCAPAHECLATLDRISDAGGFNAIMAFQILMDAANKNMDAQSRAHTSAQQSSLGAQQAIAEDTEAKAKADQKSASFSFMTNLAGVGTSFFMGQLGSGAAKAAKPKENQSAINTEAQLTEKSLQSTAASKEPSDSKVNALEIFKKKKEENIQSSEKLSKDSEDSSQQKKAQEKREMEAKENMETAQANSSAEKDSSGSKRAGIYAASTSSAQLITSAGEAVNQNLLYGAQSHEAEVSQKFDELKKSIADINLESSKASKEKAAKMVDDAISALKQHFELVKATNDRIGG